MLLDEHLCQLWYSYIDALLTEGWLFRIAFSKSLSFTFLTWLAFLIFIISCGGISLTGSMAASLHIEFRSALE
jgi:hypothetical protein